MRKFIKRPDLALLLILASPAAAQTTLTGDHVIEGNLTVQVPPAGGGAPIAGSLYVEANSVIDGSLCLGNTCSPSTTFANDETLKFVYTQQSIVFDDTSSATSPNNDWILRINDPQLRTAGGIDKFAIEDTTAGTTPFTLEAGIPDSAFWMAPSGHLGLGTSVPQSALHIVDEAPRVTLESSAATRAAREMIRFENNGGSWITFTDTSNNQEWYFTHENNPQGRFFINHSDGGLQMALTRTGNLTLMGQLYTAGSCAAGCDRVFDEDYPLPSFAEQMAAIREKGHLPNVGPTNEDGPFNLSSMTTGMLNELEKAYLYIDRLNRDHDAELQALQAEVAQLQSERDTLADILARLDALENR